jgi:hypothetical protein
VFYERLNVPRRVAECDSGEFEQLDRQQ